MNGDCRGKLEKVIFAVCRARRSGLTKYVSGVWILCDAIWCDQKEWAIWACWIPVGVRSASDQVVVELPSNKDQ